MIKLTITPILPNCQVPNGVFYIRIVNFITQKLNSKNLVCLSFLWCQVFWRNERNIYYFCSVCIFFEGSVFTFQFWMIKFTIMFFEIIVDFIIQKLKSKHNSLKKYTNWAKPTYFSLVLREREEKKTKYFKPKAAADQIFLKRLPSSVGKPLAQRVRPTPPSKVRNI